MAKEQEKPSNTTAEQVAEDEDDEPDEWDARINKTGCADENMKLTDCWHEHKDWRSCTAEMVAFQQCWKKNHNDERTDMKDAEKQD